MRKRLLNFEITFLSFLSLTSLICYYLIEYLPDNSLRITSENYDLSTIEYYLTSIVVNIGYFFGPWVVVPTILFFGIRVTIFNKRKRISDPLFIIPELIFFFLVSYFLFPFSLGQGVNELAIKFINPYLGFVIMMATFSVMLYVIFRGSMLIFLKRSNILIKESLISFFRSCYKLIYSYRKKIEDKRNKKLISKQQSNIEPITDKPKINLTKETITNIIKPKPVKDIVEEDKPKSTRRTKKDDRPENSLAHPKLVDNYSTNDLINCISESINHHDVSGPDDSYFKAIRSAIEGKLAEFKLDGKIINILKGPVVDTFELELGSGVKVSKVTGLSDDIGLVLNGAPIRIVYPMRGRATIGIEVPRNPRDFIYLDEVLQSENFNDSKYRLPIAMGKDAFGEVKIVDLAGMPHMLVAGATGAGKSVFINTLLVSLIVKMSPRELKLILIDPKQLELALYQDLPHLLLPVITDPKSSAYSLLWAVEEMERRYSILKELGVKNISGFNKKIKSCDPSLLLKIDQYYENEKDSGYDLPYIVIVIDEFADLILSKSGKEIELNVNRLAAKARAAGIHLVVATQRPSTDVVTGVVKANFPTRVAFRVSTGHDSKTILDQYGAEKLLGKGDMLYKHGVDLLRLHSSFVEEDEIEGVIDKLAKIPQQFNDQALEFLENGGEEDEFADEITTQSSTSGTADDPIYQQALEIVFESGSASASMLQRRLRVGYNRAANIVEEMERNGIVGPAQGSKPRKVLARPSE